jgi:hypothetical protein
MLGSKVGALTSVSTSPVQGSMATTEPRRSLRQRLLSFHGLGLDVSPAGVRDDVPVARVTVQAGFITTFHARLAGLCRARIARRVDLVEIARRHGANVTDHVRDRLTLRIVTDETRPEIDAGESRSLYGERCDLFVVKAKVQCNRLKPQAGLAEFLEARDLGAVDEAEVGETLQRFIHVGDLLRDQFQLVGRQVLCKDTSLAV